ncbi:MULTISPECIES: helix-turn-helix domain-containing protein [Burkholderia]|uniref:Transcriptional regulator, XRE family n=1 Tax=Burkholderia cepacia TaxID=292 RepID=A0AA88ZE35_BURCE|nr:MULTISPECIES: helix-turn-helix domain-containing protein [Burkholderia]KGC08156.1 transcriptional regulator, XRE family [Burkholderia cepacia]KWE63422.1 DNA-binding protein [Burkholderia sp. MSMB2157WGS]
MSKSLSAQLISVPDGAPAFVMIPYAEYMVQRDEARDSIPHAVGSATVDVATRAWRGYLGLTRAEVVRRMGISRSDYAKQEKREKLHKSMRKKVAAALDITLAQLGF